MDKIPKLKDSDTLNSSKPLKPWVYKRVEDKPKKQRERLNRIPLRKKESIKPRDELTDFVPDFSKYFF